MLVCSVISNTSYLTVEYNGLAFLVYLQYAPPKKRKSVSGKIFKIYLLLSNVYTLLLSGNSIYLIKIFKNTVQFFNFELN